MIKGVDYWARIALDSVSGMIGIYADWAARDRLARWAENERKAVQFYQRIGYHRAQDKMRFMHEHYKLWRDVY